MIALAGRDGEAFDRLGGWPPGCSAPEPARRQLVIAQRVGSVTSPACHCSSLTISALTSTRPVGRPWPAIWMSGETNGRSSQRTRVPVDGNCSVEIPAPGRRCRWARAGARRLTPLGFSSGSVRPVEHSAGNAGFPGAVGAAVDPAIGLDAVADHPAPAVLTGRRDPVDRAFEAVEDMSLPGGDQPAPLARPNRQAAARTGSWPGTTCIRDVIQQARCVARQAIGPGSQVCSPRSGEGGSCLPFRKSVPRPIMGTTHSRHRL